MDFFFVLLPPIVSSLVSTPFHEELSNRGEVLAWLRAHRRLPKADFLTRSDHVFKEKIACGILCSGCFFDHYLCIWRYQNRYEGANDRGNIVKRHLDGCQALRTVQFHRFLSFHLDFQL